MRRFFKERARLRAWVALAAGYAFALQLLLTGIIATEMTGELSADPAAICLDGSGSSGASHDDKHSHVAHMLCAVCTFATSTPLLSTNELHLAISSDAVAISHVTTGSLIVTDSWHDPRSSQGPPQHA